MHIHKEELDSFSNGTMNTRNMIVFLEHIDSCDFCLEQMLQEEQALLPDPVSPAIQTIPSSTRIQAPAYMKHQILKKAASPEVQASKAAVAASRRMQLFYYSLHTAVGVAAALFLLLCAANVELPLFHRNFPVYKEFSTTADSPAAKENIPIRNQLYDFSRNIGRELTEGTGALTQYLKNFPNNILNGGN